MLRFAPWFSRLALLAAAFVLAMIGRKFILDPVGAAAEVIDDQEELAPWVRLPSGRTSAKPITGPVAVQLELLPQGGRLPCVETIDEEPRAREHHHQPPQADPLIRKRNLS